MELIKETEINRAGEYREITKLGVSGALPSCEGRTVLYMYLCGRAPVQLLCQSRRHQLSMQ
jgi:hypothetical protein